MEEKFKEGLANQVMEQFESIKNLRSDFINSGAKEHIGLLENTMNKLLELYYKLTTPTE